MKFFKSKNPRYEHLRKKWISKNQAITQTLFDKHLRRVAVGSLGGLMLLTTPSLSIPSNHQVVDQNSITAASSKNAKLAAELVDKVPTDNRNLTATEEKNISDLVTKELGVKISPEINGIRLNRTYGVIGAEQHLYRYPGDTPQAHAKDAQDWAMYGSSGIAPGLGAWGYFAPSKEAFTPQDEQRERYYLAVQTFLAPGFSENVAKYRDFFKYRKMVVVNPQTGQAVVADIADAGPADWTGKHLGGSPEVMQELGLGGGPRKGPVLYFFVDDSQKDVPLGPLKVSDNILALR